MLEILAGNVVLLSSAALETELAFGRLAAGRARILVGGLGFGATARGALEGAPPEARVVVAEKVAEVVDLVRGKLAERTGRPLDDPRVSVVGDDVFDVMSRSEAAWDAILLDVDNGPHWASFRTNARLYSPAGLSAAYRAALAAAASSPSGAAIRPTPSSLGSAPPASSRAASRSTSAGASGPAPTSARAPGSAAHPG